jgi:hypothetical protein
MDVKDIGGALLAIRVVGPESQSKTLYRKIRFFVWYLLGVQPDSP